MSVHIHSFIRLNQTQGPQKQNTETQKNGGRERQIYQCCFQQRLWSTGLHAHSQVYEVICCQCMTEGKTLKSKAYIDNY